MKLITHAFSISGYILLIAFTSVANSHVWSSSSDSSNVWGNNSSDLISIVGDGIEDFFKPFTYSSDFRKTNEADLIADLVLPSYIRQFVSSLFQNTQESKFPSEQIFKGIENENCKGHVMEFLIRVNSSISDLLENPSNYWVLQTLDAWGKIPEGILSGHVNSLGDFHECVGVKARDIKIQNQLFKDKTEDHFDGKYCNVILADYNTIMAATKIPVPRPSNSGSLAVSNLLKSFKNQKEEERSRTKGALPANEFMALLQDRNGIQIIPSVGGCFANSCSKSDIQQLLVNSMDYFYSQGKPEKDGESFSGVLQNSSYDPTQRLWPLAFACYEETKFNFDAADISVMILLALIVVIALIAGIVDFWLNDGVDKSSRPRRGLIYKWFMAFSIYENIKVWKSTKRPKNDIGCLHGLRFFSTSWIILAHTYYAVSFLPQWNMVDVKHVHEDWMVLTILNSSFSVETFFVMSGMLVTYSMLGQLDRNKGRLNVLKLYAKRYIRLTPTYAILVGIMATLFPYMGNGPYWFIMNNWENICQNNWWTNLLYVNNVVNTSFLCNGETWYLANDMQFYILSPLIVYPMWKWEMIGLALLAVYTIVSVISPALIVYILGISPTVIPNRDIIDRRSFTHLYIRPYARINTFLVGIFLGWILFKTKGKKVKIPKLVVALAWIVCTVVTLVDIYVVFPWFNPDNIIPMGGAMVYAALSRFSFGIVVAWIIFACVKGYGGIVNKFLSWKVFMPLARLCYCVYLVSLHLQMVLHVKFTQPIPYDPYVQTNFFLAHMVMSNLVGFVLFLLFESPFMTIQKLIFDDKPKKAKVQSNIEPVNIIGAVEVSINNLMNDTGGVEIKADEERKHV